MSAPSRGGKRVAVMQPYFFPYAGYFRLFAAVDEFVIFDCVQFPRRGRVHRCEVSGPTGAVEWLTLPLAHQPTNVSIRDLVFASDARAQFDERLARHRWIENGCGPAADRVRSHLFAPLESVIDYLADSLQLVAGLLGFDISISRSSNLDLDPARRGEDRVIAAAAAVGAMRYVNAPGGRDLYDAEVFAHHGIELSFLPPYHGRYTQLLPALLTDSPGAIRDDVLAALR
jgi:hypothetical protein